METKEKIIAQLNSQMDAIGSIQTIPETHFETLRELLKIIRGEGGDEDPRVDNLLERVTTIENNIGQLTSNVNLLTNSVSTLSTNIEQVNTKVDNLILTVNNLSNSISGINTNISQLTETINGLNNDIDSLDERITAIENNDKLPEYIENISPIFVQQTTFVLTKDSGGNLLTAVWKCIPGKYYRIMTTSENTRGRGGFYTDYSLGSSPTTSINLGSGIKDTILPMATSQFLVLFLRGTNEGEGSGVENICTFINL